MKLYLSSKLNALLLKSIMHIDSNANILVLPICTMKSYVDNEKQWEEYYGTDGIQTKKILKELCGLGAEKERILFYNYYLNTYSNANWNKIYNYLVIPGGDAELGVMRAQQLGISNKIKGFNGDVIAYSAGALMLYEKYFLSPNWYYSQMKYCMGIGLNSMPTWLIEVHYDGTEEMNRYISEARNVFEKNIWAIKNEGLIYYDNSSGEAKIIGEVCIFDDKRV